MKYVLDTTKCHRCTLQHHFLSIIVIIGLLKKITAAILPYNSWKNLKWFITVSNRIREYSRQNTPFILYSKKILYIFKLNESTSRMKRKKYKWKPNDEKVVLSLFHKMKICVNVIKNEWFFINCKITRIMMIIRFTT